MDDDVYADQPEDEFPPLPENWAEMFSDKPVDQTLDDSPLQPAEQDETISVDSDDSEIQRGERYKLSPDGSADVLSIEQEDQFLQGFQQQSEATHNSTTGEAEVQRGERDNLHPNRSTDADLIEQEGHFLEESQPQSEATDSSISAESEVQRGERDKPGVDELTGMPLLDKVSSSDMESQPPSAEQVEWASIDSEIRRGERDSLLADKEAETGSLEQADQPTVVSQQESADEVDSIPVEQQNPLPSVSNLQFSEQAYPEPVYEQAPAESNPRKVALILSGGGARGAFQVGAEKYAREVWNYQWDIIAGVSVGAMNGAMLAMHRYARLLELWDGISDDQVYTGGFNLVSLVKILFGAKSFYGNQPLIKLMQSEFQAGRVLDDLHVGAVSLISGEYVQFTRESLELPKAILASASIPVVWPPVDVSPEHPAMVDGGVRNITPIGDVLDLEPDEIVIINCGRDQPPIKPNAADNVLSIGMRALDIMQNEIFVNDMKQFLRINALVKEADQQSCVLHHPKTGRPFKYYPCQVIEPNEELGDVLDFSQKSVQAALRAGVRRAREVLGRPGAGQL